MDSDRINIQNSITFVKELFNLVPFEIKAIQTDNGPEFQKELVSFIQSKGIIHQYIWVRSCEQNGCVERSHRTDEEEFYANIDLEELTKPEFKELLRAWNHKYNHQRLHYALNWKTPIEYLEEDI